MPSGGVDNLEEIGHRIDYSIECLCANFIIGPDQTGPVIFSGINITWAELLTLILTVTSVIYNMNDL